MNLLYSTFCALFVCLHGLKLPNPDSLYSVYNWNILEFSFPSEQDRQQAKLNGDFKPTNAMPVDVQPVYNEHGLRTFVTIPRFTNGIPYTLATVSNKRGVNGPLLVPYPNYKMHNNRNGTDCNAITSAFRVEVTECNQMWVIDSGSVGLDFKCPPQLLLFDLETDQLIHRYRFSRSLYTPSASLFITLTVNVRDPAPSGSCKQTMVYVADCTQSGLVVYDFMRKSAWRVTNRFMYPHPYHGLHFVAGERFTLMDGIFGMATDKKNLYFHPLAAIAEYAIPLKALDNSTLFENNSGNMDEQFIELGKRRSPCTTSAIDSNNNVYCVTTNPIKLLVWNVNTPYDRNNVIELSVKSEYLEFVGGIKVVKNRFGRDQLWFFSNRYQKMAAGTRNFNEINFNILVMHYPHY